MTTKRDLFTRIKTEQARVDGLLERGKLISVRVSVLGQPLPAAPADTLSVPAFIAKLSAVNASGLDQIQGALPTRFGNLDALAKEVETFAGQVAELPETQV